MKNLCPSVSSIISLLFLLSSFAAVQSRHHNSKAKQWDSAQASFDESDNAFVPYPKKALPFLEQQYKAKPHLMLDITVSIADFEATHPIFALVKGIIYRLGTQHVLTIPNYFVQDGITANCRTSDNQQAISTVGCTQHCVNNGRYCLGHNYQKYWNGSELIAEATRRMCVQRYVQDSVPLLKYTEAFEHAGCQNSGNMTECSFQLLDTMNDLVSRTSIQQCLEKSGGLTTDNRNLLWESQLRRLTKLQVVRVDQLPVVEIDATVYSGQFTVKEIFAQVCAAYPPNMKPLACQFCSECVDVRKCLWELTCDGNPLDMSNYTLKTPAGDAYNDNSTQKSGFEAWVGTWEVGFVWGIVAGLIVAVVFAAREIRIRMLVRQLADAREANSSEFRPHGGDELPNIDELVDSAEFKSHSGDILSVVEEDETDSDSSDDHTSPPLPSIV